jgi:hypothetical protein
MKNPGKLTITTQRGSIHADEKNDAYGEGIQAKNLLDVTKEPKGLLLSALSSSSNEPVNGLYSLDDDSLVICLGLDPEAPASTKLETTEGDRQLLITLRRVAVIEAAVIQRNR